ncbi:hypothetical protein NESM_000140700 [Novymonas esmeraldas]|uniref:Uncharacterized protein n=1 Tax=Novymonas esmeraldas TaxID=1808958 RepID=A0AAW0F6P8_9TRYP
MHYEIHDFMPSVGKGAVPTTTSTTGATSTTSLASQADPTPLPVCVTPSALSALLYAILFSIEFQAPVGPRPPPLRHAAASSSLRGAAPSPATLLTSAVSAMSSFWGRSATTMEARRSHTDASSPPQQQQQQQQQQGSQQGASFRHSAGNTAAAFPLFFDSPATSTSGRTLTAAESAEMAALKRQHEQPFVVPVTQVLHKLGGVHITVRETHNPTITAAYNAVMEQIEGLVFQQEQGGLSPSATAADRPVGEASAAEQSSPTSAKGAAAAAAAPHARHTERRRSPPARSSESGSSTAPAQQRGVLSADAAAAKTTTVVQVGPNEVGMTLCVRLLSRDVTRWRVVHERPLVEWRFPIIRTANESMIRHRTSWQTTTALANAAESPVTTAPAVGAGRGTAAAELTLVNDPAQVLQVLEFILRRSYEATTMGTFDDFTSGELVFTAHVVEKSAFP